jgi:hypothetical protein
MGLLPLPSFKTKLNTMKNILFLVCLVAGFSLPGTASAQKFLKKLKEKVESKVEQVVDKKTDAAVDNATGNTNTSNTNSSTGTTGKPSNKGGGGLTNTEPPDVNMQITEAESAHKAKNYSDARFSLQQALMGIEIQLGRQILKSLPAEVVQVPVDTTQDKVMSTQWGWNNLSIQRTYRKDDKQLTITIGNNAAYAGVVNMYYANARMIEASNDKQNIKQVRVKGNKAIIQYDDSKGYTLMVQLGQTSLIVWEGINFSNEQEIMSAANSFDVDGIKKLLGEQ